MSISRVYLCLIFLAFLTSSPVLCSRSPKLAAPSAAMEKKLKKEHIHSQEMLVSGSPKFDSSSYMTKNEEHVRSPALLVSGSPKFYSSSSMTKIEGHIHSPALLVSGSPKFDSSSSMTKIEGHIHSPALLVSGSPKSDSSSSMTKIDQPATNSGIASFFRYRFPFQGWPFHKYVPFPMGKPTNPSVQATPSSGAAAAEEETEKLPSSPIKGNGDGGNA